MMLTAKTILLAVSIFALSLVLAWASSVLLKPANAYADQSDLQTNQLRVYQDFVPAPNGIADQRYDMGYEVVLTSGNSENAPMPEGSSGNTYQWTMRGSTNHVLTFVVNSNTPDGTYVYTMRPRGDEPQGYTMEERTEYTLELDVSNGVGTMRTPKANGVKVADPSWTLDTVQTPAVPTQETAQPTQAGSGLVQQMAAGSPKTSDAIKGFLPYLLAGIGIIALTCALMAHSRSKRDKDQQGAQK